MPPRAATQLDDGPLSLRLKHGVHTIFLLVDPTEPFSKIIEELMNVLRERHPEGLTTSIAPPKTTPVPAPGEDFQISFGLLKAPTDHTQGWKKLVFEDSDTPSSKGLKNNAVVGFAFKAPDDSSTANFEVEFPELEDEE